MGEQMKLRRITVTALVVTLLAGTAFAQRGGNFRRGYQSYSGNVQYDDKFVFIRMSYGYMGRQGAPWAHDYPVGEEHFLKILTSISNIDAHVDQTSIMSWDDPEL